MENRSFCHASQHVIAGLWYTVAHKKITILFNKFFGTLPRYRRIIPCMRTKIRFIQRQLPFECLFQCNRLLGWCDWCRCTASIVCCIFCRRLFLKVPLWKLNALLYFPLRNDAFCLIFACWGDIIHLKCISLNLPYLRDRPGFYFVFVWILLCLVLHICKQKKFHLLLLL